MSEDVKLEPCPFCGGEAKLMHSEFVGYWVTCGAMSNCAVDVDYSATAQEEAIATWNTRTGEQAAYERGKAEVQARWKAQRESIIQTLEEWQAAYDGENEGEYQRAIGDVLAWLNGDIP